MHRTITRTLAVLLRGVFRLGQLVQALLGGLAQLAVTLVHLLRGVRGLVPGGVRCPRGHVVPLAGERYTCARCSYTYEGSALLCPNPECRAVTVHLDCPTCGLSIRNPYRWGRP